MQHKKQESTHQSLACTTERAGHFNLPESGRCWHLYCEKSSTGGNPFYHRCCGWRYWHIDSLYRTLEQLEKWISGKYWVNKWWNIECFKEGNASDWVDVLFSHAWDDCDTASAIHQRLVTLHISKGYVTCLHWKIELTYLSSETLFLTEAYNTLMFFFTQNITLMQIMIFPKTIYLLHQPIFV